MYHEYGDGPVDHPRTSDTAGEGAQAGGLPGRVDDDDSTDAGTGGTSAKRRPLTPGEEDRMIGGFGRGDMY